MKRWVTAALLTGALALTACEAEPAEPTEPSSSAPPSTEPTSAPPTTEPTGPVEPTLPPEAEGAGKRAVAAFVEYYWSVVDFAQQTGEVALLRSLAIDCGGCDGGTAWIERVHARGGTIVGGKHAVSNVNAQPAPNRSDDWIVVMQMEVSPQRVRGAGDENLRSDGGSGTYTMVVTPGSGSWLVATLQVG